MKTILRYPINSSINKIELPVGYEVLSAGVAEDQHGNEVISVWCKVDTNDDPAYTPQATEQATFLVFGTGSNLDDMVPFEHMFVGTVQKSNRYAFHIFHVKG